MAWLALWVDRTTRLAKGARAPERRRLLVEVEEKRLELSMRARV